MEGSLAGKVAVITGGASRPRRAAAEGRRAAGAQGAIPPIQAGRLERSAGGLRALGGRTGASQPPRRAARTPAAGPRPGTVHLLCNNAGIGPMSPVFELTLADWQWMLDVNLRGAIHMLTQFLPILRGNADGGHILNTCSMASMMPVPTLATYCTAKYGLLGLSEVLAMELASDGGKVGVTALCPGPVATDLGSSTRNRPADLAGSLRDVMLEDSEQFKDAVVDWISPAQAAQIAIGAVRRGDFYAITHPDMVPEVKARHAAIEKAFADEKQRREAQA